MTNSTLSVATTVAISRQDARTILTVASLAALIFFNSFCGIGVVLYTVGVGAVSVSFIQLLLARAVMAVGLAMALRCRRQLILSFRRTTRSVIESPGWTEAE